jgi:hypothetical protein
MKKIAIILAGLLLMVSSGCSDEDRKETAEKTKEAVTATKEKATEMSKEAASVVKEAAVRRRKKLGNLPKRQSPQPGKQLAI